MYGFLAGIPHENFRFTLALLPATAGGLDRFGCRDTSPGASTGGGVSGRRKAIVVGILGLGLLGSLAYNGRVIDAFIDRKDADLAVARWVERTVTPDARVLAFGITSTLRHYTSLDVMELYDLTLSDLARMQTDGRRTYLIVPLADLERQWRGHSPERNYRGLRDGPGLLPLGSQESYALFRVIPGNAGPKRPGG
ncbi:MAG: hypothetical protein NZ742_07925 [Acidobacteria bacterium]|nr:hypothetical protein [Acidobacteriota bacterium]MDW7984781.1 hypothetical protein [Acidobacteriota bacterium]